MKNKLWRAVGMVLAAAAISALGLTGVASASTAQPAHAVQRHIHVAPAANTFGAIAYDRNTNRVTWAYGFNKADLAEYAALGRCVNDGGTACRWVLWFENSWGAIATGSNRVYGTGFNPDQGTAKYNALQACINNGGIRCYVRVFVHS